MATSTIKTELVTPFSLVWDGYITNIRANCFKIGKLIIVTASFNSSVNLGDSTFVFAQIPNEFRPKDDIYGSGTIEQVGAGLITGRWTIRPSGNIQALGTNTIGKMGEFTFIYTV